MYYSHSERSADTTQSNRRRELIELRRRQPYSPLSFPFHDENDLFEQVRLGQTQEAMRTLGHIRRQQQFLSHQAQRMVAVEVLVVVSRAAAFGGAKLEDLAVMRVDFWDSFEQITLPKLWDCLLALVGQVCSRVSDARTPLDSELISWAKEYIEKRCRHKLTEAEVAGQLLLGPAHFSRMFKRHAGYTFSDYLNRIRIRNAVKDMANPDLSQAEIAARNAYNTVQYFSSVFRRYVGMTPGQYRTLLDQGEWIANRFTPLQSDETDL